MRFTQAVKPVNLSAFHLALDYLLVALPVEQDAPSRGLRCRASRRAEDNASFAYKGKAVDIKHVGRELGVRYVLEGTLQALKTHRREVVAQAGVQPSQSP